MEVEVGQPLVGVESTKGLIPWKQSTLEYFHEVLCSIWMVIDVMCERGKDWRTATTATLRILISTLE